MAGPDRWGKYAVQTAAPTSRWKKYVQPEPIEVTPHEWPEGDPHLPPEPEAPRSFFEERFPKTRQALYGIVDSGLRLGEGLTQNAANIIPGNDPFQRASDFIERQRGGMEERTAPTTTGEMLARVGGNLVGEGGQYMALGGAGRKLAGPVVEKIGARIAPRLTAKIAGSTGMLSEVAKDAAVVAPLDVTAAAVGPENSTLGAIAALTKSRFPRLSGVLQAGAENPLTRAAGEVLIGGTADVALRGAAGGAKGIGRWATEVSPEVARAGSVVLPPVDIPPIPADKADRIREIYGIERRAPEQTYPGMGREWNRRKTDIPYPSERKLRGPVVEPVEPAVDVPADVEIRAPEPVEPSFQIKTPKKLRGRPSTAPSLEKGGKVEGLETLDAELERIRSERAAEEYRQSLGTEIRTTLARQVPEVPPQAVEPPVEIAPAREAVAEPVKRAVVQPAESEVVDDLFGGTTRTGPEQPALFEIPAARTMAETGDEASTVLSTLEGKVKRGAATPEELADYQEALAFERRDLGMSGEEVALRARGLEPSAPAPTGPTLFEPTPQGLKGPYADLSDDELLAKWNQYNRGLGSASHDAERLTRYHVDAKDQALPDAADSYGSGINANNQAESYARGRKTQATERVAAVEREMQRRGLTPEGNAYLDVGQGDVKNANKDLVGRGGAAIRALSDADLEAEVQRSMKAWEANQGSPELTERMALLYGEAKRAGRKIREDVWGNALPTVMEAYRALGRTAVGATFGGLLAPEGEKAEGALVGGVVGLAGPAAMRAARKLGTAGHLVLPGEREGVKTGLKGKWYSRLQDAVSAGPGRATGAEWARYLDPAKRGFSEMEAEWTGVRGYLAENAEKKLTKDDVLGFARERGIKLEERTLPASLAFDSEVKRLNQIYGEGFDTEALSPADRERYLALWKGATDPQVLSRPRFAQYVQPGGSNYREVLVKLDKPEKMPPGFEAFPYNDIAGSRWGVRFPDGREVTGWRTEADAIASQSRQAGSPQFTSSHWPDDPNTLAHLRFTDRTINGEKTLFVEEIQSDWHQKGREKGYATPADKNELDAARASETAAQKALDDAVNAGMAERRAMIAEHGGMQSILARVAAGDSEAIAIRERATQMAEDVRVATTAQRNAMETAVHRRLQMEGRDKIPNAPYKGTDEWVGLAVRRALQEAVDGGYDRIAWASGEQSARLYPEMLKKIGIDEIRWSKAPDGYAIEPVRADGSVVTEAAGKSLTPAEVRERVGKVEGERILASTEASGAIKADEIEVGKEGMIGFYDRIVPKVFQKEAKALGVKVEVEPVRVEEAAKERVPTSAVDDMMLSIGGAEKPMRPVGGATNLSIRITPDLAATVKKAGTRLGAAPRPVVSAIARTGAGALVGAGLASEEGGLTPLGGALAGAGVMLPGPAVIRGLKGLVGRPRAGMAATEVREAAKALPTRAPYKGAVNPDEYVNLAKFAMDPTGEKQLADATERVVRERGIAPKKVVTLEETRALARTLGLDPNQFTTDVLRKQGTMNHAEVVASRDVVKNNLALIARLEKDLGSGVLDATEAAEKQATLEAVQNQTDNLIARFSRDRSEAGRTLSAHRALANETLDPLVWLSRLRRKLGVDVPEDVKAKVLTLIDAEDKDGLAQLAADLEKSDTADQLLALWKAGLLSAPTTHEVNVVSTAGNVGLENVKDPVAAFQDRILTAALQLVAKVGGKDGSRIGRSKSVTSLGATKRGMKRGARDFALGMQGKAGSSEVMNRWDYRQTNIDLVPGWLGGKVANPVLDTYQKAIFRLLGSEDKFFKGTRIEQSIYEQARVVALNENAPDVAARAREVYDGWKADGYAALPNDVALQAVSDGAVATFTDRSLLAQAASGLKRSLQQAGDKPDAGLAAKALKLGAGLVMPFTGTPSNVVSRVGEYAGGGFLSGGYDVAKLVGKAFKGEGDQALQRRAVESLGRATTGAGLLALGVVLYNKGKMTLNYPADQGERGNWEATGKQEFSLLQGDKWMSLERFSPVGNLLAVGGYMARAAEGLTDPDESKSSLVTEPALGVASMVMSQSFMEGTKSFLDAISEGSNPESSKPSLYVKSQVGSIIPNMVKRVAASLDTDENGNVVVRQADTWLDALKSGIPGLRSTLPQSTDQFGQGKLRGKPAKEFWNLSYSKEDLTQGDPVRAEIGRLGAPISRRSKLSGEAGAQYTERLGLEGPYVKQAIANLIASDLYGPTTEQQATQMLEAGGYPTTRENVRKVADSLRRELIAQTISQTRGALTDARKQAGVR